MQILCVLHNDGPIRYNELKRKITGISNVMLASTLRESEESGLVTRKQFMEIPPRVEYQITEICFELIPILDQLGNWAFKFRNKL